MSQWGLAALASTKNRGQLAGWRPRSMILAISLVAVAAAPSVFAAPPGFAAEDVAWNPDEVDSVFPLHRVSLRGLAGDVLTGQAPIQLLFPNGQVVACTGNSGADCPDGTITVNPFGDACLSFSFTEFQDESEQLTPDPRPGAGKTLGEFGPPSGVVINAVPAGATYTLPPITLSNAEGAVTLNQIVLRNDTSVARLVNNCEYTAPSAQADQVSVDSSAPQGGTESSDLLPDMLRNDFDDDGDAFAFNRVVQTTANGTLRVDAGVFYTPEPGFTGQDVFTYELLDSFGSISAAAAVNITVRNDPPVITNITDFGNGSVSVGELETLNIDIASSDRENGILTYSYTGVPAFCGVSDTGSGTARISCSPGLDDQGTYPVTVTVTDNGVPAAADEESIDIVVVDEPVPTVQMRDGAVPVAENAGNAEVVVVRGGSTRIAASVDYSTEGAGPDYADVSGTLSWPVGDDSDRTIVIPIVDDDVFEPPPSETFDVVLSNPGADTTIENPDRTTVTISDDEQQPILGFSQATVAVNEADGTVELEVTRINATGGVVSVDFATANGEALAGSDYQQTAGTLTWADGDSDPQTITVPIINDDLFEGPSPTESFTVALSNATGNAALGAALATVNIADGDQPPRLQFSQAPPPVDETGQTVTVSVVRQNAAEGAVTVDFATSDGTATAGADYVAQAGTLSWASGDMAPKDIVVAITDDADFETPEETFFIALSNPTGQAVLGDPQSVEVTITDNEEMPSVSFVDALVTVAEDQASVDLTVRRAGALSDNISVSFATEDGTATAGEDYVAATGNTVWEAGDGEDKTITIDLVGDEIFEGDLAESFTVVLSDATAGVGIDVARAQVDLTENDTTASLAFEGVGEEVLESIGTVTVSVQRMGSSQGEVSVAYQTVPGTAVPESDYTEAAGSLTWTDGDAAPKAITIAIVDDDSVESPLEESFTVRLGATMGGALAGANTEFTITINDDDLREENQAVGGIAGPDQIVRVNDETGLGEFELRAVQSAAFAGYEWSVGGEVVGMGPNVPQAVPPGEYTYTLTVAQDDGDANTEVGAQGVTQLTDTVNVSVTRELVQGAQMLQEIEGLTETQKAVAMTLDSICGRLNTRETLTGDEEDLRERCSQIILNDNTGQIVEALGSISGRQVTGQMTNAVEIGSLQFRNIAGRMRALREGGKRTNLLAGLNINVKGHNVPQWLLDEAAEKLTGGNAGEDFGRWSFFITGDVGFGEKDETDRETGFDFDTGGISVGADYRASDRLFWGVAVGYGQGDAEFDNDGGSLDSEGFSTSLYGSYATDQFYVDGLLGFGWNEHDSTRNIRYTDATGPVNRRAKGSTDGTQWSIGVEGGLNLNRGKWQFNPNVSAFYTDVSIDGFAESGAQGLDLLFAGQDNQSFTVSGGASVSYAITTEKFVLIPQLRVDYVLELENDGQIINVRFLNDPFANDPNSPSPVIPIRTDDPDDSYITVGLGVSAQFVNGISGFVDWQKVTQYDDLDSDSISFGLRWERLF